MAIERCKASKFQPTVLCYEQMGLDGAREEPQPSQSGSSPCADPARRWASEGVGSLSTCTSRHSIVARHWLTAVARWPEGSPRESRRCALIARTIVHTSTV